MNIEFVLLTTDGVSRVQAFDSPTPDLGIDVMYRVWYI